MRHHNQAGCSLEEWPHWAAIVILVCLSQSMKSDIGKSTLNPIFRVSTVPQINFLFGIRKFTNLTMNPSLIFRIGLGRRKG